MKRLGNLIALAGTALFVYTILARFIGEKSILGLSKFPILDNGFSATGMFSGIACIMLIAIVFILNEK